MTDRRETSRPMTDLPVPRPRYEDHICVCICTFKRPKMLASLLEMLRDQSTGDLFTYSIAVVDNDGEETARDVVGRARQGSDRSIVYAVEPEQNISLARNMALKVGEGDYLAWLDDDEFPGRTWLAELHAAARRYDVDGVLGPVLPHFETPPPSWVVKGRACERETFPTGTRLVNPRDMRTGNFLLGRAAIRETGILFDPRYGRTGGEDVDFFRRMIEAGRSFVWSNEAAVHETVPPSRLKSSYFLKRALLRGVANAPRAPLASPDTIKSLVAVLGYAVMLPFLALRGYHHLMRYLIKSCDHLGKILARCGFVVVKQRFG